MISPHRVFELLDQNTSPVNPSRAESPRHIPALCSHLLAVARRSLDTCQREFLIDERALADDSHRSFHHESDYKRKNKNPITVPALPKPASKGQELELCFNCGQSALMGS
jgi:hypothetical protein